MFREEQESKQSNDDIQRPWPEPFVYLTYWDDAGSDRRSSKALLGGVIVPTEKFLLIELAHAITVRNLLPEDRQDTFTEFHAYQLWNGEPPFDRIAFDERKRAMGDLLTLLKSYKLGYFYSAVDKAVLKASAVGSISPIDLAFRMCMGSLSHWGLRASTAIVAPDLTPKEEEEERWTAMSERETDIFLNEVCVVIVDNDSSNARLRDELRASFRQYRRRLRLGKRPTSGEKETLPDVSIPHLHDAMFFGDSAESVGLQLADLCGYVMRRHLEGDDTEGLYGLLAPYAFVADHEPDWSRFRFALVCHDEAARVSGPSASALMRSLSGAQS